MDIGVSLGSAQALGLTDKRVDIPATAAHLMVGEGCRFACAFCAQGRDSKSRRHFLSRISWPPFPMDEVARRLAAAHESGAVRRGCIQVVYGGDYVRQMERFFYLLHRTGREVPMAVNAVVRSPADADRIFALGADRLGLALDAASPEVFARCKRQSPAEWVSRIELLRDLAAIYPGRITTHLIAGMGETERDLAEVVQIMADVGVAVGLFAFTPVRGTPMEAHRAPPVSAYRRVQLAAYLITRGIGRVEDFAFDSADRMAAIPAQMLGPEVVGEGIPFRTSGCEGCNRPYYNERPGQTPYNYARPLQEGEVRAALEATGLFPGGMMMEASS
ncbi:MAG: radical SAM protein [Bacillota bacterium]